MKKVSRSNLKSIMKKKPNLRLGTNTDLMVQLNLLLFLHRLAEESRAKAFEARTATIKPEHIKAVSKSLLKKARG
ncbi:centromere protein W [Amia ocellicauda]|uniref:centromere protein W n=1 Tax=Amia ocellicauda TaxID=2972642 RepID=UPI003464D981